MDLRMTRTCDAGPVQYEGTIEGKFFYFRARHDEWSFTVADTLEEAIDGASEREIFVKEGHYGHEQNPGYKALASYMPYEEAEHLIQVCARGYAARSNK